MKNVLITGAAGLVGQNLVTLLKSHKDVNLICIDKHSENVALFRKIHPSIKIINADLSIGGDWEKEFKGLDIVIMNHAQISSLDSNDFEKNNIIATQKVLDAIQRNREKPYVIHISSSVINSLADDDYTRSKYEQEQMVVSSGLPYTVLRPTLMFGWFDRKHLGWLSRFMKRTLFFPIPGHGRFIRQPLYVQDFCRIIISLLSEKKVNQIFDISGLEKIYYIDMVRLIHKVTQSKSMIIHIPYSIFLFLLHIYGLFTHNPPFTPSQLKALVIPEEFPIIDWPTEFNVPQTPFSQAVNQTFQTPQYKDIILNF